MTEKSRQRMQKSRRLTKEAAAETWGKPCTRQNEDVKKLARAKAAEAKKRQWASRMPQQKAWENQKRRETRAAEKALNELAPKTERSEHISHLDCKWNWKIPFNFGNALGHLYFWSKVSSTQSSALGPREICKHLKNCTVLHHPEKKAAVLQRRGIPRRTTNLDEPCLKQWRSFFFF